jgi:hypothetical protein
MANLSITDFNSHLSGIDYRWTTKGSLSLLPGILHGFVFVGRAEDNQSEGDDRRYAKGEQIMGIFHEK